MRSSRYIDIVAWTIIVGLHLFAANYTGILAPEEVRRAENAREFSQGGLSLSTILEQPEVDELEPPLTRILAATGLSLLGPTTLGARLFPTLLSAFLFGVAFVRLRQRLGLRCAALFVLGAQTAPFYALYSGQLGPAALSTAANVLALAFLLTITVRGQASTRTALGLAGALGIALLAAGPAAVSAPLLSLLLFALFSSSQSDSAKIQATTIGAIGLVLCGITFVVFAIFSGRHGWPSTSSLLSLGCGEEAAPTSSYAWLGTALILSGIVVVRFRSLFTFGFHFALLITLGFGALWYGAVIGSADGPSFCQSLASTVEREWVSNDEAVVLVRLIGYGIYPWIAFLPLAVLRLSAPATVEQRRKELALFLWMASTLVVALLIGGFTATPLVNAASALTILCALGVGSHSKGDLPKQTIHVANAIGIMLIFIVFRDLSHDPSIFPALAFPLSSDMHIESSSLPILVGLGAILALVNGSIAIGFPSKRRSPKWLSEGAVWAKSTALPLIVAVVSSTGLLVLWISLGSAGSAGSWADVYQLYGARESAETSLYAWRDIGRGGSFYLQAEPATISKSSDLHRVLERHRGETYFATRTLYYREITEMIHRITGHRVRPLNHDRRNHVLLVYDGPPLADTLQPAKTVEHVPDDIRRGPEKLAGGAVKLVGADFSTRHVRPGQTLTLRVYLESTRTVGRDLQARIRLDGQRRHNRWRLRVDHEPTDGRLPTSRWRIGQIIIDELELVIPRDAERDRYSVEYELIGSGGGRAPVGNIRINESR